MNSNQKPFERMAFLFLKIEQMVFLFSKNMDIKKPSETFRRFLCLILFLTDYKEAECNNKSVNLLE